MQAEMTIKMEEPASQATIEQNRKIRDRQRRLYLVGVVWADGRVSEHTVLPPDEDSLFKGSENGRTRGDVVVAWINGEPTIRKGFRDQGCVLLKEVCERDGKPEMFKVWRDTVLARMDGYPIDARDEELYPPSVLERRRMAGSGGHTSGKVYVPGKGLVDADTEAGETAQAERVASAVEQMTGLQAPPRTGRRNPKRKKDETDE